MHRNMYIEIGLQPIQYYLNCWKPLKLVNLQRKDETGLSVKEIDVIKPFSTKVRKTFSSNKADRVLQSAITLYLNKKYKNYLNKSCFSFQEGLSTNSAVRYIKNNGAIDKYSVKVDILKYFYNINDSAQRNWNLFVFSNITTIKTLRELDFYTVNTLRALETGKHNHANISKVSLSKLKKHGYKSFVESFFDFRDNIEKYKWEAQQTHNRVKAFKNKQAYKKVVKF